MNLALHGFLLQVILSILNVKYGFRFCSAGEPGYLDFDNLPETNFSCQGKVIGGYYADVEAGCQMFHVCTIGQKDEIMDIKFLCLNGTVFDQETRVCERVDEVDCSKSERFYNLNLELYGNNAVTLSLHDEEDDEESTEPRDDHQQHQHMTSAGPSTTSSTTTTTPRPSQPSTTPANNVYQQHATGYPQHYQPKPAFPSVQTSQSNTHYDDKNGGYHHQYIFHNDERNNNNQATSYQLFSNQGVSSTTPTPQVHQQVRYSSTSNPQVIHSEPSTSTPIQYHVQSTSATIETLLNNNANNPPLINPLYHNHGIASTTEQFNVHNNNPREIAEYQDNSDDEHDDDDDDDDEHVERKPLEPVQSTNQGKVSKLTISPVPQQDNRQTVIQTKTSSQSSQQQQQQRVSIKHLPTSSPVQTTISIFYPTQGPSGKKPQKSQNNQQVTQHIHVPPPPAIPQLKPHQITINLPPPDIQRIVQNPSPLLPSQSRVIVTAKASVSDESGRPLNASQLITIPIPTIPSNYDEYKEGDESFDPFYRDVPKIRSDRRIIIGRKVEASHRRLRKKRSTLSEQNDDNPSSDEVIFNAEIKDIKDLKANLPIIKAILFGLPLPDNDTDSTTENDDYITTSIHELTDETTIDPDIHEGSESIENHSEAQNTNVGIVNSHQSFERPVKPLYYRQRNSRPTTTEESPVDAEPKDTVQLFLSAVDGNNSLANTGNFSIPGEQLSSLSDTIDVNNRTNRIRQEVLQTRSSSNSNKPNRRRYYDDDSIEDLDEYLPRRNIRVNKPKSFRYYDDYDVSESIETNTRQRSNRLRQRPKERRVVGYRDDYVDEDIDEEEYDENVNRKGTYRRGPQGRRVPSRNRNRYFDYEDLEVHEKPRLRPKTPNASNRNRIRTPSGGFAEAPRRRRPQSERRRNQRRRLPIPVDDISPKNLTDNVNTPVLEDSDTKSSKDIDSRVVEEGRMNGRYYPTIEQEEVPLNERKRFNNIGKNEEVVKERTDQNDKVFPERRQPYTDEYNESIERDFRDYLDYADIRPHLSRSRMGNRRIKSRYNDKLEPIPRRNPHRRNKSRKFLVDEEKIDYRNEYETTESTTLPDEEDSKTTNIPTEYTVSEETHTQEYEDFNTVITPAKVDETENTDTQEVITTTEGTTSGGILKFTDELPVLDGKEDQQEEQVDIENGRKDTITTIAEDYVDDNYEPESYVEPKVKQTLSQDSKENKKELETYVETKTKKTQDTKEDIQDNPISKAYEKINENYNKTLNNSYSNKENKQEYDKIYDDKLESTTIPISSEEYYDLDTTSDVAFTTTSSSSVPIISTSSTTIKTSTTTSTTPEPTTTTTTTTTTPSTTTSSTTTSTTTIAPSTYPTSPSTITTSTTNLSTNRATTKATAKFFKPTAFRKNYSYAPPVTTPNPVIIRRGQPLTGPKPTKLPPTYNELAPKPVIRRLPLLSRTTTTTSEATLLEEKIVEELSKRIAETINNSSNEQNLSYNVENTPLSLSEPVTTSSTTTKFAYATISRSNEVTTETIVSTTEKSNQISTEESSTLASRYNQKEQNFDNEVPTQKTDSEDSNNVPQTSSEESIESTLRTEIESSTVKRIAARRKIINKTNQNFKILDVQTTTSRTTKPSDQRKLELTSVKSQTQKTNQGPKTVAGFNCLEKEMYRFYGDVRDCRLFHYCSPGFTARQVLDFRFVCEEGTIFDEESQSCKHDVPNPKCVKRTW